MSFIIIETIERSENGVATEAVSKQVSREYYANVLSSKAFFSALGSERHYRENTPAGYRVTRIVSSCGDLKTRRTYQFIKEQETK